MDETKHGPLQKWREAQGFSREQVAVRLHVSVVTVRSWEKGLSRPSGHHIGDIGDLIGAAEKTMNATWSDWMNAVQYRER